jgi:hypothetical protein
LSAETRPAGHPGGLLHLAGSTTGCTEAFVLANGFSTEMLAEMISAGLATAHPESVHVSGRLIEVTRVRITQAGRRSLTDKPKR